MRMSIDDPDAKQWMPYLNGFQVHALEVETGPQGWALISTTNPYLKGAIAYKDTGFLVIKKTGCVELVHRETGQVIR